MKRHLASERRVLCLYCMFLEVSCEDAMVDNHALAKPFERKEVRVLGEWSLWTLLIWYELD